MDMKYKVIIIESAKRDINEIVDFIIDTSCDIKVAKKFVEKLKEKCLSLELFPNAGSLSKDHVLKTRGFRFVTYKNYLIYYLVDEKDKKVYVVSIFCSKRDRMYVIRRIRSARY